MKRLRFCFIVVALSFMVGTSQQVQAQSCDYGYAYGISWAWYDGNTTSVFGYSATELDYCAGLDYDPYVVGHLSENPRNEATRRLVDSGRDTGYADVDPAQVLTFYGFPRPNTQYGVDSYHYVVAYYYYDECFYYGCGSYWYDPFNFFNFFTNGGYSPPWYSYFNPRYFRIRRMRLGNTFYDITTPTSGCGFPASPEYTGPESTPPCPGPGPTPSPSPLPAITSISVFPSPLIIRPLGTGGRNTARITARITPAVANRLVSISLGNVLETGGHEVHRGVRPIGNLSARQGRTNASGEFSVTYTATVFSGRIELRAQAGNVSGTSSILVGVIDLAELGGGTNYGLVGQLGWHPSNHFGTATAIANLPPIADDYKSQFYGQNAIPEADKLNYNDMSLGYGGKFDIKPNPATQPNWAIGESHAEHRLGKNCDVYSPNVLAFRDQQGHSLRRAAIEAIFRAHQSPNFGDETGTANHWHLRFEDAQQAAIPSTMLELVAGFWSSATERAPDDEEWLQWETTLRSAQLEGQTRLLADARGLGRNLFQSAEYLGRSRSDQEYVHDLYVGYLGRDEDPDGYAYWLSVLQGDNANGLDGRGHLLEGFEGSQEFMGRIVGLVPTPETCDPTQEHNCNVAGGVWDSNTCSCQQSACDTTQEQSCYNQGGTWDPTTCSCSFPPPPDPCYTRICY